MTHLSRLAVNVRVSKDLKFAFEDIVGILPKTWKSMLNVQFDQSNMLNQWNSSDLQVIPLHGQIIFDIFIETVKFIDVLGNKFLNLLVDLNLLQVNAFTDVFVFL